MEMPRPRTGVIISETKNPVCQNEWTKPVGSRLTHKVSAWSWGGPMGSLKVPAWKTMKGPEQEELGSREV